MNLQVRELGALSAVPAVHWDGLHDGGNPFVSHAFLAGLETQGCLRADWGWVTHHLTLWDGDTLVAAAPMYLKSNSHGEFVFDHAWAQAYASQGLDYYPKWLCAVPYSPVTGPRLLARDQAARRALLAAIAEQADAAGLSSAHVNFHDQAEDGLFGDDWLPRIDVQYHWRNRDGWRDFDGFLAAMDHKHRKNIRQERAKVAVLIDRDTLSLAAQFDSGLNFLDILGLSGGMPTVVSVPKPRLPEALEKLGISSADSLLITD